MRVRVAQGELIGFSGLLVASGLRQAVAFLHMLLPERLLAKNNPGEPQQSGASHLRSSPAARATAVQRDLELTVPERVRRGGWPRPAPV